MGWKPTALAAYLVVDDVCAAIDFAVRVFDAEPLLRSSSTVHDRTIEPSKLGPACLVNATE